MRGTHNQEVLGKHLVNIDSFMHPMISDYYARIYSDSSKTPDPVPSVEPESFADMDPAEVPESAIYANLHTNLPRDVMCLRNRPFKESVPVYPPHATVLEYVQDFEKDEKLTDYVRYNTSVMDAEYKHNNWLVTSYDINTQQKLTESYDALIVANGHYFKPYIPDIAGLSRFKDIERTQDTTGYQKSLITW
jgi:cation diffusion facilitator CzcD-associated flavoprotein CzcO